MFNNFSSSFLTILGISFGRLSRGFLTTFSLLSSDLAVIFVINSANISSIELEQTAYSPVYFRNDSGSEEIYVSSNPENFRESAKMFYALKDLPKLY